MSKLENEKPPEAPRPDESNQELDPARVHLEIVQRAGTRVEISLEAPHTRTSKGSSILPGRRSEFPFRSRTFFDRLQLPRRLLRIDHQALTLSSVLFGLAILIYLITRFWSIDRFPIFFYSDEVNNVLFGEKVFQNGLTGTEGEWLPVYFEWDQHRWAPVLPVYIHAVTAMLFGKSILIARGTSAFLSGFAVLAVAYTLKRVFNLRYWWASAFLLMTIPAWFLYSRTTFETVSGTSFLAIMLCFYLLYRWSDPRFLLAAVVAAAAAFYSYSNLQLVILLLSILLLLIDIRYHLNHRRLVLFALVLVLLLSYPFIRFRLDHPTAIEDHLRAIGSYWTESIPLSAKLSQYGMNYIRGLSPVYWFHPDNEESNVLPTIRFQGHGNLGFLILPFLVVGLYCILRNIKDARYRILLLSLLAIPAGASMDSIEIPRVLSFVVPATLIATLGLEWLLRKIDPKQPLLTPVVAFILLSWISFSQLRTALQEGPTWYPDYGLFGMQFGVKDVYEDVLPRMLREDPDRTFILNTTWLNNGHLFPRFFLASDDQERVRFGNIRDYLNVKQDLDENTVMLMTPVEYETASSNPVLEPIEILHTINSPSGTPALYFGEIRYSPNVDQILSQRMEDLKAMVVDEVAFNPQILRIEHSVLGAGSMHDLLDGNFDTLVRGAVSNPIHFQLHFSETIRMHEISLTVGSMLDFTVTLQLYQPDLDEPLVITQRFHNLPSDPTVVFPLDEAPVSLVRLDLDISKNDSGPEAQIHVRDLIWE